MPPKKKKRTIRKPNSFGIRAPTVVTFIAISDCVEVDVVRVAAEEEETEPRLEGVDGNDEKDPNYPSLLGRV